MKRFTLLAALLSLALVIGWSGSSFLRSQEGAKGKENESRPAPRPAPPGVKPGVKVEVHYAARNDEIWVVKEVKGNWVRITFGDGEYWTNFDNVVYYSFVKD